jgi:cell division FtsZ-interacting protein ZapD
MYQQMLGGKSAQMLRLRIDATTPCVPEISANKYVLNIRFMAQNGDHRHCGNAAAHRRLERRLRAHLL